MNRRWIAWILRETQDLENALPWKKGGTNEADVCEKNAPASGPKPRAH